MRRYIILISLCSLLLSAAAAGDDAWLDLLDGPGVMGNKNRVQAELLDADGPQDHDKVPPTPWTSIADFLSNSNETQILNIALMILPELPALFNAMVDPKTIATLFAPTDAAFLQLGEELDTLLADLSSVPALLKYHLVLGEALTLADLEGMDGEVIQTDLEGSEGLIKIRKDGANVVLLTTSGQEVPIYQYNIGAGAAVVHTIHQVMLPGPLDLTYMPVWAPSPAPAPTPESAPSIPPSPQRPPRPPRRRPSPSPPAPATGLTSIPYSPAPADTSSSFSSSSSSSSSSSVPVGAIVGGVVGGLAALAVLSFFALRPGKGWLRKTPPASIDPLDLQASKDNPVFDACSNPMPTPSAIHVDASSNLAAAPSGSMPPPSP